MRACALDTMILYYMGNVQVFVPSARICWCLTCAGYCAMVWWQRGEIIAANGGEYESKESRITGSEDCK